MNTVWHQKSQTKPIFCNMRLIRSETQRWVVLWHAVRPCWKCFTSEFFHLVLQQLVCRTCFQCLDQDDFSDPLASVVPEWRTKTFGEAAFSFYSLSHWNSQKQLRELKPAVPLYLIDWVESFVLCWIEFRFRELCGLKPLVSLPLQSHLFCFLCFFCFSPVC